MTQEPNHELAAPNHEPAALSHEPAAPNHEPAAPNHEPAAPARVTNGEPAAQARELNAPAAGSETVLRAMMALALIVIVVVASYAIFFRRPAAPAAPTAPDPAALVPLLVQPAAAFPASVSWPALLALADELPSSPGWQTRYQAARNLAYLGSDQVPWAEYAELLDEHRQFCNFRATLPDGRVVIEENAARQIILGGLKDLAAWHKKHARIRPSEQLLAVYYKVDMLANSPIADMKSEAEKTRAVLFR